MAAALTTMFAVAGGADAAHASYGCYSYTIDCTNPAGVQAGNTQPCSAYATYIFGAFDINGSSDVTVWLRYSGGGAGATCGTAWAKTVDWHCGYSGGQCWDDENPYEYATRKSNSSPSVPAAGTGFDVGYDYGTYSRQLKDCCWGVAVVKAGSQVLLISGAVVAGAVTAYY